MSEIKFKIAAKTHMGLVRTNNEDNFQASSDLSISPMTWVNDKECDLGEKGALLVVADGMGGMNAGEVASDIAIQTIRNMFTPENLTDDVLRDASSINCFLKDVIVQADEKIKAQAKENPENKGMGTTIVIGWLLGKELHIAWCGDSRAYILNSRKGLFQLSKDHSYVQELVDSGRISPEDAFDFPDSNIITRCLCDSSTKAKPDVLAKPYPVEDGDIILLCTDGLSGLIRDYEIEKIAREHEDNLEVCITSLINAACNAGGHDNITIAMCKITSGAGAVKPTIERRNTQFNVSSSTEENELQQIPTEKPLPPSKRKHRILYTVVILIIGAIIGYYLREKNYIKSFIQQKKEVLIDTLHTSIEKPDTSTNTIDYKTEKKTNIVPDEKKTERQDVDSTTKE